MNGNGKPDNASGLAVDVMASVDAQEAPALALEDAGEVLAGNRFHTTISNTWS